MDPIHINIYTYINTYYLVLKLSIETYWNNHGDLWIHLSDFHLSSRPSHLLQLLLPLGRRLLRLPLGVQACLLLLGGATQLQPTWDDLNQERHGVVENHRDLLGFSHVEVTWTLSNNMMHECAREWCWISIKLAILMGRLTMVNREILGMYRTPHGLYKLEALFRGARSEKIAKIT